MNKLVLTLIILFIILLFVVLYINYKRTDKKVYIPDTSNKYSVFQFNHTFSNYNDSDQPTSPFTEVIEYGKINYVKDFNDANLILFTDFSLIDQNIADIKFKNNVNYTIYGIKGSDEMANKANLARYMSTCNCIPTSFALDTNNFDELKKYHKDGNIYILKKNVQRQEGMLITKDIDFIINKAASEDYVVCQELLQNPFIVNGRKINIRIYMLVVIENNDINFYIYKNGFIYYTPKMFEKSSLDKDVNITTGYISRSVYEENPLTIQDFMTFIGQEKSQIFINNVIELFTKVKNAYKDVLLNENKNIPGKKFNVYGIDIAPNMELLSSIIEVNKGPSLIFFDEADQSVKQTLIFDCFTLVNVIKGGNPNNFIKI